MHDTKTRDGWRRRPLFAPVLGTLAGLALICSSTVQAQAEQDIYEPPEQDVFEPEVDVEEPTPEVDVEEPTPGVEVEEPTPGVEVEQRAPEVEVEVEEPPETEMTVIEQERVERVEEERGPMSWRFDLELYGFAPGRVQGDATVAQQRVDIDFDRGDIFDQLELAGGVRMEAWMGRVGLIVDGMYMQLEDEPVTGLDGMRTDFTSRQFVGDAMLGVQLVDWESQFRGRTRGIGLEVGAGVRGVYLDQELEFDTFQIDANDGFAKFVSAVELPIRLADNWGLRGRGTLAVPDPTWTATGLVEYMGRPVTVGVGYRYDSIDRDGDNVDLDVETHSLYVSLGFRFGDQPF